MNNSQRGYISILISFAIIILILFGGLFFFAKKDIEWIKKLPPLRDYDSSSYYRLNPKEAEKRAYEIQAEVEERNTRLEEFYRETGGIDINTGEYLEFSPEEDSETKTNATSTLE